MRHLNKSNRNKLTSLFSSPSYFFSYFLFSHVYTKLTNLCHRSSPPPSFFPLRAARRSMPPIFFFKKQKKQKNTKALKMYIFIYLIFLFGCCLFVFPPESLSLKVPFLYNTIHGNISIHVSCVLVFFFCLSRRAAYVCVCLCLNSVFFFFSTIKNKIQGKKKGRRDEKLWGAVCVAQRRLFGRRNK